MRVPIEELIKTYQTSLFSASFAILKNTEDANDVVQETFIAYYKLKKEYESEAHLKAWLLRVTVNKSRDLRRTYWFRNRQDLNWEDLNLTEADTLIKDENDKAKELYRSIMNLPETLRVVIHLYYYEDLSVKEIATILKVTEASVKMRLSRARKQLKNTLQEEWADDES